MIPESHRAVLDDLLRSAGLHSDSVETVELAGISTNTVYFATLCGGHRLVLRIYGDSGWPEDYDRARQRNVPAPTAAFWDGYGELNEVNLIANRLLVALFCAYVQYEIKQTDPQRHVHVVNWLTRFSEHISRLYELLARQ